jgi:hypothetical protein
MDTTKEITYTISRHAKERYTQRLLNKEDNNEIQRFIVENEDKIITDINKMINYGELIYSGKQTQKDSKGNVVDVFLKDCWIVLIDHKTCNTITLYRIDLGCGDEFNQQYISKMMEKLNESKDKLMSTQIEVETESNMYRDLISDSQAQINDYKSMIKKLESLCAAYQDIIDNNVVKVSQANKEVADVVNTLIGKREF